MNGDTSPETSRVNFSRRDLLKLLGLSIPAAGLFYADRIFRGKGLRILGLSPESERKNHLPHLFTQVCDRLTEGFWSEDGNWKKDMMNDATSYAPLILYPLSRDNSMYEEKERTKFAAMADRTVKHELAKIQSCIKKYESDTERLGNLRGVKEFNDWMVNEKDRFDQLVNKVSSDPEIYNMVYGLMALVEGAHYYNGSKSTKDRLKKYSQVGLILADLAFLYGSPDVIKKYTQYFGYTPSLAFIADANFRFFGINNNVLWGAIGKALVDKAIDKCLVKDDRGVYFDEPDLDENKPTDITQGSMLIALADAFLLTNDQKYRDIKGGLVKTIKERLTFPQSSAGFGAIRREENSPYVVLSTNNCVLYGLSKWGDEKAFADQIIEFYQTKLIYPEGQFKDLLGHSWTEQTGLDQLCCTGCNFLTLYAIYLHNN